MSYYNVVRPCVVGKLHYAKPTEQPIEVDDEVAAPLVADGSLEPYGPGRVAGKTGTVLEGVERTLRDLGGEFAEIGEQAAGDFAAGVDVEPTASPAPVRRRRKAD